MEEDCTQCVEVGRTGCSVLGYHHTRIRTRLLCRFRLPHSVYQPLRWDSLMSLRLLPFAGYQSIFLCSQSLHQGCLFRFRAVQKTCCFSSTHHGWHYRLGAGENRKNYDQDWLRPWKWRSKRGRKTSVGKNIQEKRSGTPYRCRYHCRRRYARRHGTTLRNWRSNRIFGKSA